MSQQAPGYQAANLMAPANQRASSFFPASSPLPHISHRSENNNTNTLSNLLNLMSSHRLTLTGVYKDAGVAQMEEYPLHKLLVQAMRQHGWHEMDTYFKPTLADNAMRKIMLRVLANETRVYEHYPGLYTLEDGHMALYGFVNNLLKASLQSKAKWLTSWPVADAPARLDEHVAFVLPKAMRRAPDEAAAPPEDNEDIDQADAIEAAEDSGLADLSDAPQPHDAAPHNVFPQPPSPAPDGVTREEFQAIMQPILAGVNEMREAAVTQKAGAASLPDANGTIKEAERNGWELRLAAVEAQREGFRAAWRTKRAGMLLDLHRNDAKIKALKTRLEALKKEKRPREAEDKRSDAEAHLGL
ncbi:hypothetical protein FN846DRAFT_991627 [Sphaerosporella brunnea]|uniref:Uncharacterized protein n=1 Tax=Sphaerosporella brunnea TaxID=1250544 RepID=A0A5J5EQ91_9PEZI|nr:hypothetical protein FN846DRAFT_991627 [Sphaerosporella brunnea]